jgi:hypothetical protein
MDSIYFKILYTSNLKPDEKNWHSERITNVHNSNTINHGTSHLHHRLPPHLRPLRTEGGHPVHKDLLVALPRHQLLNTKEL